MHIKPQHAGRAMGVASGGRSTYASRGSASSAAGAAVAADKKGRGTTTPLVYVALSRSSSLSLHQFCRLSGNQGYHLASSGQTGEGQVASKAAQ